MSAVRAGSSSSHLLSFNTSRYNTTSLRLWWTMTEIPNPTGWRLLHRTPRIVKDRLRSIAPRWVYRAFARAIRGKWPFAAGLLQVYASDDFRVWQLEEKLWGGFESVAVAELEALRARPGTLRARAGAAALALARYYACCGRHDQALECLSFGRRAIRALRKDKKAQLIEIHCLLELDRPADAQLFAERTRARRNRNDACLDAALASVFAAKAQKQQHPDRKVVEQYFACLNKPLLRAGFAGLKRCDPTRPLALDNLAPVVEPEAPSAMPAKVSVLMAVYNGREYVECSARSILNQSWRNLELVVVDDASTDDSWSIIQTLAAADARVVPIRHADNAGAYVARNTALAHATGTFVTVNDADDWAHPQKIEAQVTSLLNATASVGNLTDRMRVAPNMTALPKLDSPYIPVVHTDYSSLMLPRDKVLEMGGWDTVRFGADSEFISRLQSAEGESAITSVHPGVPLSVSLVARRNLTAASATGIRTHPFGSRQVYKRQSREWHQSGADLKMDRRSQLSPFPVPAICYYQAGYEQSFDLIVVSNFCALDDTSSHDVAYLKSLREVGLKVAILTWPCYESTFRPGAGFVSARLCRQLDVVTLVHGEKAHCDLLSICQPRALMHKLDRIPDIVAKRVVIADDSISATRGSANVAYEREVVQGTVAWAFCCSGEWIPKEEFASNIPTEPGAKP